MTCFPHLFSRCSVHLLNDPRVPTVSDVTLTADGTGAVPGSIVFLRPQRVPDILQRITSVSSSAFIDLSNVPSAYCFNFDNCIF